MSHALTALVPLAALIGLIHTLVGPDHYIPFVMMSRARGWSPGRTAAVTALCGIVHVAASVVLGGIGIAAGIAIAQLEAVESTRGTIAAWLMIAFGIGYAAWGFWRFSRSRRPHKHIHIHNDSIVHIHDHDHGQTGSPAEHHRVKHDHSHGGASRPVTPWVLFLIFLFGPCEVLIPLLMYPAANESLSGLVLVTAVFGATTIGTMLVLVLVLSHGLKSIRLGRLENHSHTLAGITIALCGGLILIGF